MGDGRESTRGRGEAVETVGGGGEGGGGERTGMERGRGMEGESRRGEGAIRPRCLSVCFTNMFVHSPPLVGFQPAMNISSLVGILKRLAALVTQDSRHW